MAAILLVATHSGGQAAAQPSAKHWEYAELMWSMRAGDVVTFRAPDRRIDASTDPNNYALDKAYAQLTSTDVVKGRHVVEVLNAIGALGWELVDAHIQDGERVYTFKREAP